MAAPYTTDDNVVGTNSAVPDLKDLITNIAPKDHPITAGLKTTVATGVKHEFLLDTLATRGSLATVEGASTSYGDEVAPTRAYNFVEQMERPWSISDVALAIKNAGMSSQLAYTIAKASAEFANALEYDVINGTKTDYTEGTTAAVMGGIVEWISTCATALSAPLDEVAFNNLASDVFDQGGNPTEVFVKGNLKRQISSWSVNQRNVEAADKRLIRTVDVYVGDFGQVKVMISRDVPSGDLLLIDPSLWAIAWLINPHKEDRAKTGSSTQGVIIGDATLESLQQKGNGKLTSVTTTLS